MRVRRPHAVVDEQDRRHLFYFLGDVSALEVQAGVRGGEGDNTHRFFDSLKILEVTASVASKAACLIRQQLGKEARPDLPDGVIAGTCFIRDLIPATYCVKGYYIAGLTEAGSNHPPQVLLVGYDHVVEALTTDRADQPLHVGRSPRRACCDEDLIHIHPVGPSLAVITVDTVAVTEEVTGCRVPWECPDDLLCCPSGCGLFYYVEVDLAANLDHYVHGHPRS